jgi:NAD(P)-dependent dehydrogenase (short-subunit alcohol dehydrogenase family)
VDAAAKALQASGARVVRLNHDRVMNDVAAKEAFDEVQASVGAITVMVFGDQAAAPQSADLMTLEGWRAVTAINLDARFFCAAELARRAIAGQRKAVMLHLMGKQAESATSGNAAQASAAGGILNLNMSLAVEWARDNIRSNVIATRLVDQAGPGDAEALGTLGTIAAYYCSDYASYITGSCIGIDEI